jgi:hypothetical protein
MVPSSLALVVQVQCDGVVKEGQVVVAAQLDGLLIGRTRVLEIFESDGYVCNINVDRG